MCDIIFVDLSLPITQAQNEVIEVLKKEATAPPTGESPTVFYSRIVHDVDSWLPRQLCFDVASGLLNTITSYQLVTKAMG